MKKHLSPAGMLGGMPVAANFAAELAAETHHIEAEKAGQMISDFYNGTYGDNEMYPASETFNAAAIRSLLDAPGAVGIRIYNGTDTDGHVCFILASVGANGQDGTDGGPGLLAEDGQRHPRRPGGKKPGKAVEEVE